MNVNGWSILLHPLMLDQIEDLISEVEWRKDKDPQNYRSKNCTKRLRAIIRLIKQTVPSNPASTEFRPGKALGDDGKHWRRARFLQQYRLFFQYNSEDKIIIFVWMNDENTKRAYGSKTDAYATFRSMIAKGNPPDDYNSLIQAAKPEQDCSQKVFKKFEE